jgi:hypothetical protein
VSALSDKPGGLAIALGEAGLISRGQGVENRIRIEGFDADQASGSAVLPTVPPA